MIRPQDILTANERKILTFVLLMIFLGLGLKYLNLAADDDGFAGQLDSLITNQELVDIRVADATELESLPRIGPKLAEKIVAYRSTNPFYSSEDLVLVKGIGVKMMESIRPYLVQFGPEIEVITADTIKVTDELIDINRAGIDELVSLPGIGPVKAQRIIDRRTELGKFNNVEELISVKGIGEKTLAKITPFIKCER